MVGALLPSSHSNAEEPLPLLLLLHGSGGSHRFLARLRPIIEQAWSSGDLLELVVVTPSAGRSFYVDYHDGSQLWESFIMRELLPDVRERFNVVQDRYGTLVSGFSMGGLGSLRLAFKYPAVFQAVAAMAPGIEPALSFDEIAPIDRTYRSDEEYEEKFGKPVDGDYWQQNHPIFIANANIVRLRESGLPIYIEVGNEDRFGLFRGAELLHRILYDGDIKHEYRVVHGARHGGLRYAGRFLDSLRFLDRVLGSNGFSAETQELILPVVVNGYVKNPLHLQTTIRIVNLSNAAVEVTLEAYGNDGVATRIFGLFPIPMPGTKTVFKIEPLGSVEAFTAGDVPSFNGWARLTYDASVAIQATAEIALINASPGPHPICRRPSTEIVTSAQVEAVKAANKFAGFAVTRPYRRGAYALSNPSTTHTAEVLLSLLDLSGKLIATGTVKVPPKERISQFLTEFLSNPPTDLMGSLRITSDIPVGVGALSGLLPEGRLASVPVSSPAPVPCIQVIAPARNPLTGECRNFPTPCDVPEGWETWTGCCTIATCSISREGVIGSGIEGTKAPAATP